MYATLRGFISEVVVVRGPRHARGPRSPRSSLCRAGTISSSLNGLNNIRLKLMVSIQGACHASIYLCSAATLHAGPTSHTIPLVRHSASLLQPTCFQPCTKIIRGKNAFEIYISHNYLYRSFQNC